MIRRVEVVLISLVVAATLPIAWVTINAGNIVGHAFYTLAPTQLHFGHLAGAFFFTVFSICGVAWQVIAAVEMLSRESKNIDQVRAATVFMAGVAITGLFWGMVYAHIGVNPIMWARSLWIALPIAQLVAYLAAVYVFVEILRETKIVAEVSSASQ
jgi:hypothetical protein